MLRYSITIYLNRLSIACPEEYFAEARQMFQVEIQFGQSKNRSSFLRFEHWPPETCLSPEFESCSDRQMNRRMRHYFLAVKLRRKEAYNPYLVLFQYHRH